MPSLATGNRPSAVSDRPPGKTNLFGIKAWASWRWPIRMRGTGPSKRTRISVAASRGLVVTFFFAGCFKAKTVHPKSPLQAHNSALYDGHQGKCQAECQGQPEGGVNQVGWLPDAFHDKNQRHQNMTHNKNREVGWCIVSPRPPGSGSEVCWPWIQWRATNAG